MNSVIARQAHIPTKALVMIITCSCFSCDTTQTVLHIVIGFQRLLLWLLKP